MLPIRGVIFLPLTRKLQVVTTYVGNCGSTSKHLAEAGYLRVVVKLECGSECGRRTISPSDPSLPLTVMCVLGSECGRRAVSPSDPISPSDGGVCARQ